MKRPPSLTPRQQQLVRKPSLTTDEQHELASSFGVKVVDLPPSMRGGLMGIFGFTNELPTSLADHWTEKKDG